MCSSVLRLCDVRVKKGFGCNQYDMHEMKGAEIWLPGLTASLPHDVWEDGGGDIIRSYFRGFGFNVNSDGDKEMKFC